MPRSILKGPSLLLVSRQVESTSGVGRAHGPPPPSSPGAAPEPQPGQADRGHAPHPSPVCSSATQAFQDTVEQGPGGQGRPLQQEPSGGADPRRGQQPHWSQEQGLGRSCRLGRRGLAGRRRQQQAGPGLRGDRPVALTGKKDRRPAGKRLDLDQG